jgi:FixJ family two-component response regulator
MSSDFAVYLVDDNAAVLKAVTRLLRTEGLDVRAYQSAHRFLAEHDKEIPGCVILDISMPDCDGREVHQKLNAAGAGRPIIFLTGQGNIPMSVEAMRSGAVDFLTKPVQRDMLLAAIERARLRDRQDRRHREAQREVQGRLSCLTPREREVMTYVVAGRLNKQIAAELGTVEKTIKVHRSRMMSKLGVRNVADLVRMSERASVA